MKINGPHMGFGVNVKPMIEKDGKIIREYPMIHNLVLDSGLEMLATQYTADCFKYAAVGTGATPTRRASADTSVTVSKTGTTITASAAFFSVGSDDNRVLVFKNSGTVVRLVSDGGNTTTQYECDVSGTEVSQECEVLFVGQTALANRIVSSNTYKTTSTSYNGSTNNKTTFLTTRYSAPSSITVSQSGTTATASGAFFSEADVGRKIKYLTDSVEYTITAYTSTTQVTVDTSATRSSQNVAMKSPHINYTRWRTFQFPVESSEVTYTEAGWSYADPATTNLFGRVVFSEDGVDITVDIGERLLLYVELNSYIDTSIQVISALPITNLTVAAKARMVPSTYYYYYSRVTNTGASDNLDVDSNGDGTAFEPYGGLDVATIAIGNDSTVITSDSPVEYTSNYAEVSIASETYIANSYSKYFVAFFTGISVDLTSNWYDIRLAHIDSYARPGFRIRFDSVQSKTVTNTVQLVFKKSWGRYIAI